MEIRPAHESEAERLSALALRSKAHWGYPADVLEGWRGDLSVSAADFRDHRIFVAVEEQELLFELGRGQARDLVDARLDLINAKNQLTGALVQHTITRLQFWRDLGILNIKENGKWEEVQYVQN